MPHISLAIDPTSGPIFRAVFSEDPSDKAKPTAAGVVLIDSGASGSMLSPNIVVALKLSPVGRRGFASPGSAGSAVSIYNVAISVGIPTTRHSSATAFVIPDAVVFGAQPAGCDCLLGRDLLRDMMFVYDGIRQRFTLSF